MTMTGPDTNGALRERVIALYTFLKEFTELRTKTVRSFEQYDQVLWMSELPREPECECAAWDRSAHDDRSEVWLSIRQPRLNSPPEPPAELRPWLVIGQLRDSSLEMPELRESISNAVDVEGERRIERQTIGDHPDVKNVWERFVEDQWWPWAEEDRRAQAVQRQYTRLFSMYQRQQRLGEQYEVIFGLGLLSWRAPDNQDIRRHLIAANANIVFDGARGVIMVGPAGEGAKARVEQEMLDPSDRPDPDALRKVEEQLADVGERIWDSEPIDTILRTWVRSASPQGEYNSALSRLEGVPVDPTVTFAPALILRKRTDRSYVQAFESIITQLTSGADIPPAVAQFATVDDGSGAVENAEPGGTAGSVSELYFPLEWNDAQRQIVERLSRNRGVLVQGPPGTGKSHTIVNLICHLLASGQRVLVTSHTARALKVLQRFLKEKATPIAPLAVVLLGDDRDAIGAMEASVQGITSQHNAWNAKQAERRIAELEAALDAARREEATVLSELRAIREQETYVHSNKFEAYDGTLAEIAARLREEEGRYGWFKDKPSVDAALEITSEDFRKLVSLLRREDLDEWDSAGYRSADPTTLPSPDYVADFLDRERNADGEYQKAAAARQLPEYSALSNAKPGTLDSLRKSLRSMRAEIERISGGLQDWAPQAAREVLGGQERAWRDLLDSTTKHIHQIGGKANWVDETNVIGLAGRDREEVRADADEILAHLEAGGSWGIGSIWQRSGQTEPLHSGIR